MNNGSKEPEGTVFSVTVTLQEHVVHHVKLNRKAVPTFHPFGNIFFAATMSKSTTPKAPTMFASVCIKYGPANEVFEFRRDVARPSPSRKGGGGGDDDDGSSSLSLNEDQILVRNQMTSVNPADCKQRSGNLVLVSKHEFPLVLGQDFCGEIVAVGPNVTRHKVGDAVMGSTAPRNSCSAEYVLVFQDECAKKPSQISAASAAATPTAYCTAWKGLFDESYGNLSIRLEPKKEEDCGIGGTKKKRNEAKCVLIVGASGSVGSAAVQLAVGVAKSGRVVAICGTKNVEYVRGLGENVEAIDYNQTDYAKDLRGDEFDLILDCVGGDGYYYQLHPFLNFGNPRACYVTCVGPVLHGGSEPITYRTLLSTVGTLVPRLLGNYLLPGRWNSRYKIYLGFETGNGVLERVAEVLERGIIDPRIDPMSPVPLRDLGKAHEMVETGHSSGKVVVEICDS